ncbi:MAG: hypothetical protein KatS3mg109_1504 [Pirellulaceae bacterium]|nr:MAG: hypothetical protein KatS3mg109_1504 [Pirellulaceae bacterium]GIW95449.1 MAG: hypothetical protein KatS3mg110_3490 [Pirellulaceae bacterium]
MTITSPVCQGPAPAVVTDRAAAAGPAILLEFSGVVCDDSLWKRWLWRLVVKAARRTLDYATFEGLWNERLREAGRPAGGYWDVLGAVLAECGLRSADIEELLLAAKSLRRMWDESQRPLPGVRPLLALLRQKSYVTAILSLEGWDVPALRDQLSRMKLDEVCDHLFVWPGTPGGLSSWWPTVAEHLGRSCRQLLFISSRPCNLRSAAESGVTCLGVHACAGGWDGPKLGDLMELPSWLAARPLRVAG